jgi:hypothetical protein
MTKLTKSQQAAIEHLASLKIVGIFVALAGLIGLLFGLFTVFFSSMSSDVKQLSITLICFSFGILIVGCLLRQAYNIIEKLYKK